MEVVDDQEVVKEADRICDLAGFVVNEIARTAQKENFDPRQCVIALLMAARKIAELTQGHCPECAISEEDLEMTWRNTASLPMGEQN